MGILQQFCVCCVACSGTQAFYHKRSVVMTNLHLVTEHLGQQHACAVGGKKDWTTIVVNLHPCKIYETQPEYIGQSVN